MLILSRRNGEVIKLGDNIEITVLSIQGDQVKIGIKAPKDIEILRKEIYEQIQLENKQASLGNKELINFLKKIK